MRYLLFLLLLSNRAAGFKFPLSSDVFAARRVTVTKRAAVSGDVYDSLTQKLLAQAPPSLPPPALPEASLASQDLGGEGLKQLSRLADAQGLGDVQQKLAELFASFSHNLGADAAADAAAQALRDISANADAAAAALQQAVGTLNLDTEAANTAVSDAMASVGIDAKAFEFDVAAVAPALAVLTALAAGASVATANKPKDLPLEYDINAIMAYYNARPPELLSRLSIVSFKLAVFAFQLWRDRVDNKWEKNMPMRAEQLRVLVTWAGAAYIKVAQGVSVRPDILPEEYLKELQLLQDKVEPFSSAEARTIIEQQLGRPLAEVFEDISAFDTPVASASLGQVYKARLRNGETVAVKVQRPDMLQRVTLDLYVSRIILLALSNVPSIRESCLSILAVVDNWAVRFVQELDYEQEARNGERFAREMAASRAFGEAIIVPKTYTELTSRFMLVTQWVDGVKVSSIDIAAPGGRERLKKIVATLLNAYLTQLLESGFLHADPHPGNFLCTPDGRLAILDYGLMTEITTEQRYALLEYVTHLSAKDYEATLGDLITLGFIPREIGDDPAKAAIVAPLLATVLEQLSNGGGAKAITIETVGEEVEELGKQYPLAIPSWFGLVVRCFGALEGLGLQIDPKYSIVQECMPYLSRRLLTESSDRMHRMLRTFLYGKDGRYLKIDRVDEIVSGYSTFTALAAEASTPDAARGRTALKPAAAAATAAAATSAAAAAAPAALNGAAGGMSVFGGGARSGDVLADPVARDALQLLFSKDGNYIQDLVVEELVRMTDALGREASLTLLTLLRRVASAPFSPASLLRAFTSAPLPLLYPLRLRLQLRDAALSRVSERLELAIQLTEEDRESLSVLRRLVELVRGNSNSNNNKNININGSDDPEHAMNGMATSSAFGTSSPSLLGGATPRNPAEFANFARQISNLVTTVGPGARVMLRRYAVALVTRSLTRLADGLDAPSETVLLAEEEEVRVQKRQGSLPPVLPQRPPAGSGGGGGGSSGRRRQPFENSSRM